MKAILILGAVLLALGALLRLVRWQSTPPLDCGSS